MIAHISQQPSIRQFMKAVRALSDETRLRILNLLLERECCVCEVVQALDISQTRASRNLGILHDAGFLKLRRDGLWALYSINDDLGSECVGQLISVFKEALGHNEIFVTDRERLKKTVRVGPGCARQSVI